MRLCLLASMSQSQRRRSPPAGATSPPRVYTFVPKRFTRRFQNSSHGWGKAWEGLPLGREWRLCWAPSPAKATLIRRRLHIITAHAAPALSFLGKVCRAGGLRFMRRWGERGVCTSSPPPRCSTESFDALVKESNTRLRICRVESLHHRATGMEIIGILVQLSNMGYDSLSTRLSILLC